MPVNSKRKGAAYERELASQLRGYGFEARRTAQFCGNTGDAADVIGLDGIHIEAKRCEQTHMYDWIAQAKRDARVAKKDDLPAVFWRKSNHNTLVYMELTDWIRLYKSYYEERKEKAREVIHKLTAKYVKGTVYVMENDEPKVRKDHSVYLTVSKDTFMLSAENSKYCIMVNLQDVKNIIDLSEV